MKRLKAVRKDIDETVAIDPIICRFEEERHDLKDLEVLETDK